MGYQLLVLVWWSSALVGGLALVVGVLFKKVRRPALATAAAGLLVAGLLGIASIGIVLLALSAGCAVAAARQASPPPD